jgi:NTE family protein
LGISSMKSRGRRDPLSAPAAPRLLPPYTLAFIALVATALGCGTYFRLNKPLSAWDPQHGYRGELHQRAEASDDLVLLLAFPGGGTRAAAFD